MTPNLSIVPVSFRPTLGPKAFVALRVSFDVELFLTVHIGTELIWRLLYKTPPPSVQRIDAISSASVPTLASTMNVCGGSLVLSLHRVCPGVRGARSSLLDSLVTFTTRSACPAFRLAQRVHSYEPVGEIISARKRFLTPTSERTNL